MNYDVYKKLKVVIVSTSYSMPSYAETALSYFRQPPHKLSCCSSVIAGATTLENPQVAECANFGGGKAPEGYCGAAYAVKLLRPDLEDIMVQ